MTRNIYDQFTKDCLEELFRPFGKVEVDLKVASEVREIDFFFQPDRAFFDDLTPLGKLGQLGLTPAIIEPYRNPITINEVRKCLKKSLDVQAALQRRSRREETALSEAELPMLWILSPTISQSVIQKFKGELDLEHWGEGIYFCGEGFRTVLVAIHQLPQTPETLWLRLFGRGRVQVEAIEELQSLPEDNKFRDRILEIVSNMIAILEVREQEQETLDIEEREFLMQLSTVYTKRLEEAEQLGEQRGEERAQRNIARKLLTQGMEIDRIAELTELPLEEVAKLRETPPSNQ